MRQYSQDLIELSVSETTSDTKSSQGAATSKVRQGGDKRFNPALLERANDVKSFQGRKTHAPHYLKENQRPIQILDFYGHGGQVIQRQNEVVAFVEIRLVDAHLEVERF